MEQNARFVPLSYSHFKQVAKDLAWAYNKPLSLAQEALARIYGFADLYEIKTVLDRPHEATKLLEGHEGYFQESRINIRGEHILIEVFGSPFGALGSRLEDIGICKSPSERSPYMSLAKMVADEINYARSTEGWPEDDDRPVTDYFWFEERRPSQLTALMGQKEIEGIFYRTPRGEAVRKAVSELLDPLDASALFRLIARHPNNPEPAYGLYTKLLKEEVMTKRMHRAAYKSLSVSLRELKTLLPPKFAGVIEPSLASPSRRDVLCGCASDIYIGALALTSQFAALAGGKVRESRRLALEAVAADIRDVERARYLCFSEDELEAAAKEALWNPRTYRERAMKHLRRTNAI